jgi:hypothetical protein
MDEHPSTIALGLLTTRIRVTRLQDGAYTTSFFSAFPKLVHWLLGRQDAVDRSALLPFLLGCCICNKDTS